MKSSECYWKYMFPRELKQNKAFLVKKYLQLCTACESFCWLQFPYLFVSLILEEKWLEEIKKEIATLLILLQLLNLN